MGGQQPSNQDRTGRRGLTRLIQVLLVATFVGAIVAVFAVFDRLSTGIAVAVSVATVAVLAEVLPPRRR